MIYYYLNRVINVDFEKEEINRNIVDKNVMNTIPDILKEVKKENIKELDVRPIIDSGKDPFPDIMSFVKGVKEGEIFLLVNSFEPFPLYSVLSKKGFEHFTEKKENKFHVYFYKSVSGETSNTGSSDSDGKYTGQIDIRNVIEIDVRELEPPEPMVKILETLSQVDEETLLLVHHHREPMMLYPKLEERGYQAVTNKIEENYYKVVITKKGKE